MKKYFKIQKQVSSKTLHFFNSLYQLKISMDDFIKRSKYDLRETRFSQNYETSIELINQEETDYENPLQRNTFTSESPFKIKKSFSQIQHEESFIYTKDIADSKKDMIKHRIERIKQKNTVKERFTKSFSCLNDNILTRDSFGSLDQSVKYESGLQYLSNALQQDSGSDSSQQEDVFSEKLSTIRGLSQKLFSLQQKIKVSSVPSVNPFFDAIKLKVEKGCENFILPNPKQIKLNFNETNINQQLKNLDNNNELAKKESEIKYIDKSGTNQSLQSQSMLLDKDNSTSERELSTLKINPSKILEPEVQIVQIIKVVEVPYLIEVVRESEQKIESKKSFYFEQNYQLHRTFEEFTQRESLNDGDMLNMQTRIRPSTMEHENHNDFQLEYSGTNIMYNPSHAIQENSVLSMNESNRTFHNELKQKRNDISYNFDDNSQILSKLLTKHNPSELQEFDEKLKSLQVQNDELKQKFNEKSNENNQLQEQNKLLTSELQSLIEFEFIYLQKLKQYQQKLQTSKQEFAQIQKIQSQKLRQHYDKIIEQYENQQSQYANRIIAFQQLFQQHQNKQNNLSQFMQGQLQQIQYLQKLCQQKDNQIQNQAIKRGQIQDLVVKRQTELKIVIESLEKDNAELKNLIKQIHTRYQSEGFYILREQAEQIKKTIQEKDSTHIEELEQLQNRYTSIISKYQAQLQMMKKGLQKVRIDKSVSISRSLKSQNSSLQQQNIKQRNDVSCFKKRQNVLKNNFSSGGLSSKQKLFETQKTINGLNQLKMRHVESTEDSNAEIKSEIDNKILKEASNPIELSNDPNTQKFHQLLSCEISYLKEENSKLKNDLTKQRKDKQNLSQRLSQITNMMSKQISQLSESEQQLEKNEEVLEKCVEELQKQYEMNKKLKQELQKTKQLMKNQLKNQSQCSQMIDEQQIKLHPLYLELNKKIIKSKKYIKVLEKQILELTLIPDLNQQTNKCCQNKDTMIKELKQIAFGKLAQSQTSL